MAWEAAGSDELALGVAVGMDRERERGPGHRGIDLKQRLAADGSRRRHSCAAAAGLREAHVCIRDHRLRTDVGHRLRLDRHRLGAELEAGHADSTLALLAVAGDLPVLDLDPSAQLVGLAEEVLPVPLVEVV